MNMYIVIKQAILNHSGKLLLKSCYTSIFPAVIFGYHRLQICWILNNLIVFKTTWLCTVYRFVKQASSTIMLLNQQ